MGRGEEITQIEFLSTVGATDTDVTFSSPRN